MMESSYFGIHRPSLVKRLTKYFLFRKHTIQVNITSRFKRGVIHVMFYILKFTKNKKARSAITKRTATARIIL